MAPTEGSAARVAAVTTTVGGALGGLLLVGIVAAIALILVLRARRENEAVDDESGSDDVQGMAETMDTFRLDDDYLSQEAPSAVVVGLANTVPDEN
jgi:hypothetical protein